MTRDDLRKIVADATMNFFMDKYAKHHAAYDLEDGDMRIDVEFSTHELADAILDDLKDVLPQPRDIMAELRADFRDVLE